MNRELLLLDRASIMVARFDHPPGCEHVDPTEESAGPGYSANFVERGSFEVRLGSRRWRVDSGSVFVSPPGLAYHCRHEDPFPDDVCLSLRVSVDFADGLDLPLGRIEPPVVALTNRLAYLRWRLAMSAASADGLAVETAAAEIWGAMASPDSGGRLFRQGQLSCYAGRIDRVCQLMAADAGAPLTLDRLSREAAMSPFHFARVFRALIGVSPHRYLMRLRLAAAASRLRAGDRVTEACYGAGFGNLSHFVRLFRRELGVTPSAYRRGGTGGDRLSKKPQA